MTMRYKGPNAQMPTRLPNHRMNCGLAGGTASAKNAAGETASKNHTIGIRTTMNSTIAMKESDMTRSRKKRTSTCENWESDVLRPEEPYTASNAASASSLARARHTVSAILLPMFLSNDWCSSKYFVAAAACAFSAFVLQSVGR